MAGQSIPHSGQKLVVSSNSTNTQHQHSFDRSLAVIRPGTGDVLYAWVNLGPVKPPSEVMLKFYTVENNGSGSWEHRAYWGANSINSGTNKTPSRYPMGALPTIGQWVRLEVPASTVGLEGRIIEGMAFTLYSGPAAWDSAGIVVPDMDGDGGLYQRSANEAGSEYVHGCSGMPFMSGHYAVPNGPRSGEQTRSSESGPQKAEHPSPGTLQTPRRPPDAPRCGR